MGTIVADLGGLGKFVWVTSAYLVTEMALLLGTLTPDTSKWLLTVYMIVAGLGVGFSFSVLGVAGIHCFDMRQRGSANSTLAFVRSLGMTAGITVFGMIQRNLLTSKLSDAFGGAGGSIGETFGSAKSQQGGASQAKAEMSGGR